MKSTLAALADHKPRHFKWHAEGKVGVITLDRPDKKNPLTFESYAELRDFFRKLQYARDINAIVVAGSGGNFCSGGDVHEIIGRSRRWRCPSSWISPA
jgi:enoyl-CoA hydratase/carnithine racemase